MQDGIIKGTGNSRYLKSISNFLTQYPTYQDFVAALVAGTLPIDLNGINETGWDQLGTALNKANLLSDETAEALGLPSTAVPDDALMFLAQYISSRAIKKYKLLNEHTYDGTTIVIDVPSLELNAPYIIQIDRSSLIFQDSNQSSFRIDVNGITSNSAYVATYNGINTQFGAVHGNNAYISSAASDGDVGAISNIKLVKTPYNVNANGIYLANYATGFIGFTRCTYMQSNGSVNISVRGVQGTVNGAVIRLLQEVYSGL